MTRSRSSASPAAPRRATTILDIARRAGVSTATVSRAIAKPESVAPETRARVMAAIEESGYTPNATARSLRARSTKIVLALVPGMSNTFFTPILNAIEDTLSAAGYGLIIGDTRNNVAKETLYARLIRAGQVDGVILFTGHLPRDEEARPADGPAPIVLLCNEIPGESSYSIFDVANRQAARAATEHLIAAGHRRIAHIRGPANNVEAEERMKGFVEALKAAGLAFDPGLVWGGSFRYEAGLDAAERYLALASPPTAVFAAADHAAIGFIKAVREAGLRTPGDVSVIGFDDIEDYCNVIDPPLTTMRQPRAELGRLAAEDLIARMARGGSAAAAPVRTRLRCTLVERRSVHAIGPAKTPSGDRRRRARRGIEAPAGSESEAPQ
jgi:LacI family repressor for deo operon, udp, cdd, tsx, nupC, and nupG